MSVVRFCAFQWPFYAQQKLGRSAISSRQWCHNGIAARTHYASAATCGLGFLEDLELTVHSGNRKVVTRQSWTMRHPHKCDSVVGNVFGKAATVVKTISAFRSAGIWTVNRDLFQDHNVFPSSVNIPVIICHYNYVVQ